MKNPLYNPESYSEVEKLNRTLRWQVKIPQYWKCADQKVRLCNNFSYTCIFVYIPIEHSIRPRLDAHRTHGPLQNACWCNKNLFFNCLDHFSSWGWEILTLSLLENFLSDHFQATNISYTVRQVNKLPQAMNVLVKKSLLNSFKSQDTLISWKKLATRSVARWRQESESDSVVQQRLELFLLLYATLLRATIRSNRGISEQLSQHCFLFPIFHAEPKSLSTYLSLCWPENRSGIKVCIFWASDRQHKPSWSLASLAQDKE